MPALATAMVTGPSARSAAAKKACTDFSSRTSTAPAKIRSPPSPAAACSTASLRRSPSATRPPAAWNAWAMPWPMPAPAPVMTTMALLKSKPLMPVSLLFLDGEVRLVKNLTDLDHVAFVGGAPLRPFHEIFFRVGLHHPITAQHFFRLDERPIGCRLAALKVDTPLSYRKEAAP